MTMTATAPKEVKKPNLRYQRDKDREMVKGVFKFFEVPGGSMSFVFRAYKEDQVERYDFVDGGVYTVPLGVARHLNKNGWYPEYEYIRTDKGVQTGMSPDGQLMRVGKKIRRFGFQSLEFLDPEDLGTASEVVVVDQIMPLSAK